MKEKLKKVVAQMTCSEDELSVIKKVAAMGTFSHPIPLSISDYIRTLVTADIVAKKKASKHPEMFAMSLYDWQNLTEGEREQYMNQIGPVKPNGLEYFLKTKTGNNSGPLRKSNDLGL